MPIAIYDHLLVSKGMKKVHWMSDVLGTSFFIGRLLSQRVKKKYSKSCYPLCRVMITRAFHFDYTLVSKKTIEKNVPPIGRLVISKSSSSIWGGVLFGI